jgi:hypothetical protein
VQRFGEAAGRGRSIVAGGCTLKSTISRMIGSLRFVVGEEETWRRCLSFSMMKWRGRAARGATAAAAQRKEMTVEVGSGGPQKPSWAERIDGPFSEKRKKEKRKIKTDQAASGTWAKTDRVARRKIELSL